MSPNTDILVLGATGFTGRLVAKQLNEHRDRSKFTFSLAARSKSKLDALVKEFDLSAQIPLIYVDVTKENEVEEAVKTAKVVINTVGPYWRWGTPVVRACLRYGVHYVDLTGETPWIKRIVEDFDFAATQNHTIIIPSCGFDSIPSDLSVYLSVKALKARLGPDTQIGESVTAHKFKSGISGGTLASTYAVLTEVPPEKVVEAMADHSLSPDHGIPSPPHKLVYSLPRVSPPVVGGFFLMGPVNRNIVLRTRGLFEISPSTRSLRYGPSFSYEEFHVHRDRFAGAIFSLFVFSIGYFITKFRIAKWLFKRFIVDRLPNPTDREMEKGFLKSTNVTSTVPTSFQPSVAAKTIVRIQGDPGYLRTTMMLIECGLALLDKSKLTPLGREGGVLTAVTALGDELPKRLEQTGKFEFETSIIAS